MNENENKPRTHSAILRAMANLHRVSTPEMLRVMLPTLRATKFHRAHVYHLHVACNGGTFNLQPIKFHIYVFQTADQKRRPSYVFTESKRFGSWAFLSILYTRGAAAVARKFVYFFFV